MNSSIQPRGLRRAEAAAYIGISPSHFDTKLKSGDIPEPKKRFGVTLWDRHEIDDAFDSAAVNDNKPEVDDTWAGV